MRHLRNAHLRTVNLALLLALPSGDSTAMTPVLAPGGTVTVMLELELIVYVGAATPPMVTDVTPSRFEPSIVTAVPGGPPPGENPVIFGGPPTTVTAVVAVNVVRRERVSGPVLVTTSPFDRAVGRFYPLGAMSSRETQFGPGGLPKYGAIGTFGIQGVGARQHDLATLGELSPGQVHNVDARSVIRTADGIAGAHNDICHPELGRMLWRAVIDA